MIDAKTLQRLHVEMLVKFLAGRLFGKHPVVKLEGDEACAKASLEVTPAFAVVQHFLGLEVTNKLLHIVTGTLPRQELASRDIEEGHTAGCLAEMHGTKEIVFLVVQHRILHGHTWRHQFGDASLHQLFRQLRVLQLVADGHALAGTDQFRQIGVQRMVRKTRHLVALVIAIITMRQRDTQNLSGNDGILAVGLVEVATTKQQHGLRVFRLEVEKLFHHRSQLLFCHNSCKGTKKLGIRN